MNCYIYLHVEGQLNLVCVCFLPPQLNLKFEIEVLCKHIAVEIADVPPSKLLEDSERAKSLNQLSSPKGMEPLNNLSEGCNLLFSLPPSLPLLPLPLFLTEQSPSPDVAGGSQPSPPLPTYQYEIIQVSSLAGMTPHLQINPQVTTPHAHAHTHTHTRARTRTRTRTHTHTHTHTVVVTLHRLLLLLGQYTCILVI